MTFAQIAPPLAEPLNLAEVKAHLRIDGADEDALLSSLITTARAHIERETGLCLMTQRLRLYLDRWPRDGILTISKGPVRRIDTVTVYDADGRSATVPLSDHLLDGLARPARLWLAGTPVPTRAMNGIEVDFTAGFGDSAADVPDTLKRAMLTHIAHMYEFRGVVAPDMQPAGVPAGYARLIASFCRRSL